MTAEMKITIAEYKEALAAPLAAMYNTWDPLWPGGYTRGVPFDADRVKKQFGRMNALAILVAIDEASGKPVGSCTLHEHWRDKEAAYIGTLGVSPDSLNQKVGKKLLLESVRRVTEAGFARVDLNTWAGNMRAVPLYKKIGLMWNPGGEGLTMEGYIPGILKHPLCRRFFEEHMTGKDDWYRLQVRDITQAPDNMEDRGMAVYNYHFREGDDRLNVVVDRYARGICGVQEEREGSLSSVRILPSSQNVVCGVQEDVTLEILNGSTDEMHLSIELSGPRGITFTEGSKTKLTVPSGKTSQWSASFVFGPESELHREGIKAPSIKASIETGGARFELVTGLKLAEAADIYTRQGHCRLSAGGKCSVPLTLFSNLAHAAEGRIHFETPNGLNVQIADDVVKIPQEGPAGTIIEVEADSRLGEGSHDIWLWLELDGRDSGPIVTRRTRIPVFCLGENGVAVGEDDRAKRIVVAGSDYVAYCRREGGILQLRSPNSPDIIDQIYRTEIGPPFGLSPFRFAERDVQISSTSSETVVSLNAQHPERPLWIEDRAIFEHGTGIVRREVWVKNTGKENQTLQVRIVGRQMGITFNPGQAYVSLQSGVVGEPIGVSRLSYPSLPNSPDTFKEDWITTSTETGTVGNWWNRDEVDEVQVGGGLIGMLSSKMTSLPPGEMRMVIGVTTVFGTSGWREVRRKWMARTKGVYEHELSESPPVHSVLDIHAAALLLPHSEKGTVRVSLKNMIPVPIEAEIEIDAPKEWYLSTPVRAGIHVEGSATMEFELNPSEEVADSFGVYRGSVHASSGVDFTSSLDVVCLGRRSEAVRVRQEQSEGKDTHHVENGEIEFTVSSDYGGCLTSLKNKKGVEFMISSFPNAVPRPGAFLDNYYGGVQPIVFDEEMSETLTKAKTNQEEMSARAVEDGFWKGVEVSWQGALQKTTRGVEFSLKYLTSPGSPLVLIKWRMKNVTSAPLRFFPMLYVDPAIDGDPSGLVLQSEWSGVERTVSPAPAFNGMTPSTNYIYVKPRESSGRTKGLAMVSPDKDTGMVGATIGPLIFLAALDVNVMLMPGEEKTMKSALLVDPESMEQVKDLQSVMDQL